ncbi:MAG TPA: tetratricopeptide repeat protein [Myxococcaceae bacterium]|nr:tetratricopeptide repeat protein [Myxococcaceae bacterium]
MYNLLISLAAGIVVALLVTLFGFSWWAGIVPGIIAFLAVYVVLARRTMQQVQLVMARVQKDLSTQPSNPREMQTLLARAVKTVESAMPLARWQFLIGGELHAHIGMLHYIGKNHDEAAKHFAVASKRNFTAQAMAGALHYRRQEHDRMREAFELAVKHGKKESVLWAAYAWCLIQLKDRSGALAVLNRGVEKNPSDEKLKNALGQVQNDKRLKMRPFEPAWWQFQLEPPPTNFGGGGRRVQFMRR